MVEDPADREQNERESVDDVIGPIVTDQGVIADPSGQLSDVEEECAQIVLVSGIVSHISLPKHRGDEAYWNETSQRHVPDWAGLHANSCLRQGAFVPVDQRGKLSPPPLPTTEFVLPMPSRHFGDCVALHTDGADAYRAACEQLKAEGFSVVHDHVVHSQASTQL